MKKSLMKITSALVAIVMGTFAVGCSFEGFPSLGNPPNSGSTSTDDSGSSSVDPETCHHSYEHFDAKTAKCDESGWEEHYKCTLCGQYAQIIDGEYVKVRESKVMQTVDHTWVDGKATDKVDATCDSEGMKIHYYCTTCEKYYTRSGGKLTEVTKESLTISKLQHSFTAENTRPEYLLEEALPGSPAKYQKSCANCGAKQAETDSSKMETFTVGETLTTYEAEVKTDYAPRSLSVTMYDTELTTVNNATCLTYGFTWNTVKRSVGTTLYYCEGDTFDKATAIQAKGFSEEFTSYAQGRLLEDTTDDTNFTYYISKVDVQWKVGTTYTYCVGDRYVDTVGDNPETYTITTTDPRTESFTFTHLSDSQTKNNSGTPYGTVLEQVLKGESSFVLHTGDVVEYSRYESWWTEMLHTNAKYLSKIPVMAVAGNHDATYKSARNSSETYKHFHYKLPKQNVGYGIYYAFTYGKVRFIMLNANFTETPINLPADQYNWLKAELQAAKEKEESGELNWTIVSLHNPLYSAGKWGSNPNRNQIAKGLRNQIQSLFEEYGVDLVLQGHDHCVTKYEKNGVIYLMNGTAGTSGGAFYKDSGTEFKKEDYDYAFEGMQTTQAWAEISVTANELSVTVKRVIGSSSSEIVNPWTLTNLNAA